ncbi:class E sortase [Streptomyces griseus]|uniref:class E sortase n=1 Tax=Streptomyces griseus TaxID=1911 RepID=UPI00083FE3F9|nr:class E sortase [Streptomyces griseus]
MTARRPEPDAGQEGPHAPGAYEADGTFESAVERLADPLNDPLPGRHASPRFRAETPASGRLVHEAPPAAAQQPPQGRRRRPEPPGEWYDPEGYARDWYGQPGPEPAPRPSPGPVTAPAVADETVALRTVAARTAPFPQAGTSAPDEPVTAVMPVTTVTPDVPLQDDAGAQDPEPRPAELAPEPLPTGGRAERRRAAKGRGRRRGETRRPADAGAAPTAPTGSAAEPAVPMSRLEARRAARAAKDSPAVVASRVVGEVFITLGVLMLLFVAYQLWWTNVRADQIAGRETHKMQDGWANGARSPGVFEPGQGFAIMHIPKLDVVAPIAEGISKERVLDRGMIGHYGEGKLKTAMPSAKQGNFSVAGHRNTHGEPFRYINKLKPGDPIVVETQDAYYTYEMTSILPQTSPSNVSVIDPVPRQSGFTGPGRYITLTTCTPEFTSTYRMIVWGKMVDERPRSKGKPDALIG